MVTLRMTLRESMMWLLVGIALAPASLLINSEAVGYIRCHREVEQVSSAVSPTWDAATFRCGIRL